MLINFKVKWFAPLFLSYTMSYAQSNFRIKYPETPKVDQQDDYFGTIVKDPYRWLENDTAAKVKAWVVAQNKVTEDYLSHIPFREKMRKRISDFINFPKYTSPFRVGDYYIFSRNNGLQNQPVFYSQKGLSGTPEVLIDPNKFADDGTVAITLNGTSKDGKYLAYSISSSGSDWQRIEIIEIESKKVLEDKINWVKFPSPAWFGNGFYYSGYAVPEKGKEFSMKNEFQKIYYHKLGEPQSKDKLIYEDLQHPQRYVHAQTTEDENYLLLYVRDVGKDGMQLLYKPATQLNLDFKILFEGFDYDYQVINAVGDMLLVSTNHQAPNNKIVLVDPQNSKQDKWKTIVPEKAELIKQASTLGGKLFVNYLKDVSSRVLQYDYYGKEEFEVPLPGLGTVEIEGGARSDKFLFYTFTSFIYPPTVFKYEVPTRQALIFAQPEVKFNVNDYETKQVFYPSKDGTKIPLFITCKKGIKLTSDNPTLLFAYGGFNLSKYPEFNAPLMALLEAGGVYAHANIRGGGEYGENWHKAGMQLNKQNVFDDFIAAAEYLIAQKYTNPQKLAIIGRSNGGLLIGAVINQRPDLFKVAFPKVGVMDMLRFQKFTVGWGWINDYGSSDSLRHFKNLYGYSPLHTIREHVEYPAVMVTTADHDDRVVPAHSFKYIATLQEKYKGPNPTLIRIDFNAGHGATGKPTSKIIAEDTDIYSFMLYNMGVKY